MDSSGYSVDLDKLKTLLKFDGVDTSNFTDDEWQVLFEAKLQELEGLTGASIYPRDESRIVGCFKGKVFELNFYPVSQIVGVYVDDECVCPKDYNVNYNLGIVYFKDYIEDSPVRVDYSTGLGRNDFQFIVLPLVKDMIGYNLSYGKANLTFGGLGGFASSVREGDVSINLANKSNGEGEYGYSPGVNSRIDELRNKFNRRARVKWL